jgi:putative RNA 2'-phosphotransferase
MDEQARTKVSKFLSFVLRHEPGAIGIQLDRRGWVDIGELLRQCQAHGHEISRAVLEEVVATSPKRRFAISEDGLQIRANQGHSTEVDLDYEAATPPEILFHGTIAANLDSIRSRGLERMQRHHVHLSPDPETARVVGARRGKPVVLRIFAGKMQRDGHPFLLTANGVWLTAAVPPAYIEFPEG